MYNFEEVEIPKEIKVQTVEKYSLYRYLEVYNDLLPSNSIFLAFLKRYPKQTYFKAEGKYANRLDLISREIYDTPHLWWFLGLFNNIVDPDNFNNTLIYYIEPNILFDIFEKFDGYGKNVVDKDVKEKIF